MLKELPFPKGLTGSSGNSKASISIKEETAAGMEAEERAPNNKILNRRKTYKERQEFLKTFCRVGGRELTW